VSLVGLVVGVGSCACLWGAVCKNIISDRFSTKTAISGEKRRSSPPLSAFRCKKRMLSQNERAESEPFDTLQLYLCMQR